MLRAFTESEDGAALILVAILLPVLIGFSLLAIDMARVNSLHNDLQKASDAFALAAAAELDGLADAEDRAERALLNLVQNSSRFSDDGTHILTRDGDITWRFLDALPANDADPITDDHVSEAPEDSRFIEVTVTPTGFSSIFPASYLGGADTFNVGATAVGGFAGVVVCDMTPLFICNPFEDIEVGGEPISFHEAANSETFYGRGLRLVSNDGGSHGQWGPGNFGFLRPKESHGYGAGELGDDIARTNVRECVNAQGLYFRTGGPAVAVRGAINTRFDIYEMGFSKSDDETPPAPNVRKGFRYKGKGKNRNACNMEPAVDDPTNFLRLTQDQTYEEGFPKLGTGDWQYEAYLAANNLTYSVGGFVDDDGQPYDDDNPPSRYDLYMYEFENNLVNVPSRGGETGEPGCYTGSGPEDDPERRLIYGAVVNCKEHAEELNGQSGGPVPAVGFASFFLTEPVDQATTGGDIMAEIVDIDGIEGRGTMINFARDNVQLYR